MLENLAAFYVPFIFSRNCQTFNTEIIRKACIRKDKHFFFFLSPDHNGSTKINLQSPRVSLNEGANCSSSTCAHVHFVIREYLLAFCNDTVKHNIFAFSDSRLALIINIHEAFTPSNFPCAEAYAKKSEYHLDGQAAPVFPRAR